MEKYVVETDFNDVVLEVMELEMGGVELRSSIR